MNTLIKILSILIFIALGIGFYLKFDDQTDLGNKVIGISVLVGTFVLLPLFLYHRWKDKNIEDYMLTNENLEKMKKKKKGNK